MSTTPALFWHQREEDFTPGPHKTNDKIWLRVFCNVSRCTYTHDERNTPRSGVALRTSLTTESVACVMPR